MPPIGLVMPDWLFRSRSSLRQRPRQPSRFELDCQCGKQVSGTRTARYQQIECLDCGEPLFVLPDNVYPEPPLEKLGRARKQPVERTTGRSVGSDERQCPIGHQPRTKDTGQAVSPGEDTTEVKGAAGADASERVSAETSQTAADGLPLGESPANLLQHPGPRRRIITSFRMILLLIGLLVVATSAVHWHKRQREQAELTLQSARKNGALAVADGNFAAASREYLRAASAGRLLGRSDAKVQSLEQLHRQSEVVCNLAATPLPAALSAANLAYARDGRWQKQFATAFGDDWLVLDAEIARAPDRGGRWSASVSGRHRFDVRFPLRVGGAQVHLTSDASHLETFVEGEQPERMIFAAQVAGVRRDTVTGSWIVRLRDDVVVITSQHHLGAAGFDDDDQDRAERTRRLISRQARLLGVSP